MKLIKMSYIVFFIGIIFLFCVYCKPASSPCTYEYLFQLDSIGPGTYRVPYVYSRDFNCNNISAIMTRGELGSFSLFLIDSACVRVINRRVIKIINPQARCRLQIVINSFKREESNLKSVDTLEFRKSESNVCKGNKSSFAYLYRRWVEFSNNNVINKNTDVVAENKVEQTWKSSDGFSYPRFIFCGEIGKLFHLQRADKISGITCHIKYTGRELYRPSFVFSSFTKDHKPLAEQNEVFGPQILVSNETGIFTIQDDKNGEIIEIRQNR